MNDTAIPRAAQGFWHYAFAIAQVLSVVLVIASSLALLVVVLRRVWSGETASA